MAETTERARPYRDTAKGIVTRIFRNENTVLIVIFAALVGIMSAVTKGMTIQRANVMNVLLQSSVRGVSAVGEAFVILSAGIDLSVGGVGLMCSMFGAALMTSMPDNIVGHPMSIYAVLPIMVLVGAGWGSINGSAISRIGMPALIVTLAMWEINKGTAMRIYLMFGGASISEQPENLAFFGEGTAAGVPVLVIIFIVVVVIGYYVLNYTRFGRWVYAVGGNPVSAWLSGIPVKRTQFFVYIISGLLAGLSAVMFTARAMSASMRTLVGHELDVIASVIIGGVSLFGGRGSLIGVVIGVLIVGVINNGMSVMGASPAMVSLTRGMIIFAAVAIDYARRARESVYLT